MSESLFSGLCSSMTYYPNPNNSTPTHVKTHKLLQVCKQVVIQICSQAVDKLSSHCLFPVVVTSLEQGCSNKSDTVMI